MSGGAHALQAGGREAAGTGWYSSRMQRWTFDGPFEVVTPGVPGANPGERPAAERSVGRLVLSGYAGPALPSIVTAPRLAQSGEGSWRLSCLEGTFEVSARGVDLQWPEPRLFDGLLAPFALRGRERVVARGLLMLLGLPGGVRLLRAWHARRR